MILTWDQKARPTTSLGETFLSNTTCQRPCPFHHDNQMMRSSLLFVDAIEKLLFRRPSNGISHLSFQLDRFTGTSSITTSQSLYTAPIWQDVAHLYVGQNRWPRSSSRSSRLASFKRAGDRLGRNLLRSQFTSQQHCKQLLCVLLIYVGSFGFRQPPRCVSYFPILPVASMP